MELQEVGEREGRGWEKSTSRDSNSGRPKRSSAICWRTTHETISADRWHIHIWHAFLRALNMKK